MPRHRHIVLINNQDWHRCGYRMTRWIDTHISEDCYRLRFSEHGPNRPVGIAFEDETQALLFRLGVVCGDPDSMEERVSAIE